MAGQNQTLTWTRANELASIIVTVGAQHYLYDANGQRMCKGQVNSADTPLWTVYEFFPHYELKVQGGASTAANYYFFGGQRVATRNNDGSFVYLHSDHLGSVVAETLGTTAHPERYHAYGSTRSSTTLPFQDYKFTGQVSDGTGLVYMNARYYDPAIGQFISPDTIVPNPDNLQDYNRYMYVRGNPLKMTDPSGHAPCAGEIALYCDNPPAAYDNAPAYIVAEMNMNVQSAVTKALRHYNGRLPQAIGDAARASNALEAALVLGEFVVAGIAKGTAYQEWKGVVGYEARWDHKKPIVEQFGDFPKVGGAELRYDFLSNVHYGFVGFNAGFSQEELLLGAGVAQFMNEMGRVTKDSNYFRNILASGNLDPMEDQYAILLGIGLAQQYGTQITLEQLLKAIKRAPGIEAYREDNQ